MKRFVWTVLCWSLAGSALAYDDTYTLEPRTRDLFPGDGWFEEGTRNNPYVVREHGRETGWELSPRSHDLFPGDGFMEEGSASNPWEIRRR